eukprot:g1060.t1
MLVLSSGLLNCGDAHKASDRAKAEFIGALFLLVFNVTLYSNFMQYMWRKGQQVGRCRKGGGNPAKASVLLLLCALLLLAVDPMTTTLKHVGWDAFSEENLPRHYACEGEGASKKCNKKTIFGYFVWGCTLGGLVVMAVAMWQYTIAMGNNCVATAYDIASSAPAPARRRPEGESCDARGTRNDSGDFTNPSPPNESTTLLTRGTSTGTSNGRSYVEDEEEPAMEPGMHADVEAGQGGRTY